MGETILGGDFTVYYEAENRQKRIKYTGSGSTYTVNQVYSALQDLFDELAQMDDGIPMSAQTPTEYTIGIIDSGDDDPWFIDMDSVEYIKGGSIKTASWKRVAASNTGVVRIQCSSTGFNLVEDDIGQDITHGDGDAGTLLDVNTSTYEIWVRPDSSAAANNFDSDGGTLTEAGTSHTATQLRPADTGELLWANVYSIGTIEDYTHLYIRQNDALLTAYKGASDWWGHEHIDVLVQIKAPGPSQSYEIDDGYLYVLARKYTAGYDYFAVDLSAGGRNPIPLATGADLDNTTGYRVMTLSGKSGNWNIGDRISHNTDVLHGIITSIDGNDIRYFLAGDPIDDFEDTDTVTNMDDTGTGTVSGAPSNYGPAALGSPPTITFGADDSIDIDEDAVNEPYSIVIDCNQNELADVWEWLKYITRRGNSGDLDAGGQVIPAQFYLGEMLQAQYNTQTGAWTEGSWVFDTTTKAVGLVVADHDDGTSGDLILRAVRGTFTTANTIADAPAASITLAAALQEDNDANSWVDETADAISAGGADVDPFPATEAIDDAFYIGAATMFSKITIDIATSGVAGVALWEYWNGSSWADLEAVTGFSDGTSDLTAAPGTADVTFPPPADWKPTLVWNKGPYYFVRLRVTTVYTTNPILDEVTLLYNNYATLGTVRTIAVVKKDPLGNFAGGKFFGAPGVVVQDYLNTEANNFQLTTDDNEVKEAPTKVTITVGNTRALDRIAVFRLAAAGGQIKKDQYSGTAQSLGATTVVVAEDITVDTPGRTAGGALRVVDADANVEYRYRFTSWTSKTFTLFQKAADVAEAGTTTTKIIATGGFTNCKVGDIIYNSDRTAVTYVSEVVDNDEVNVYPAVALQASGDNFRVGALVADTTTSDKVYVPFVDAHETTGDDETPGDEQAQITYLEVEIPVRIVARQAGDIIPFSADSTITSAGMTMNVIRTLDAIYQ